MEIITSLQNKKIKELNKLKDKKTRDKEDLFLVEGDHLVNEAYNMNQLKEVLCIIIPAKRVIPGITCLS